MAGVVKVIGGTLLTLILSACVRDAKAPQSAHPYDEEQDAAAAVQAAFQRAGDNRQVLLVFGANWCPECRRLDAQMVTAPLAQQLNDAYEIVKIDVGQFDRNKALVHTYDRPTRKGIPAIVIAQHLGTATRQFDAPTLTRARKKGSDTLWQMLQPKDEI